MNALAGFALAVVNLIPDTFYTATIPTAHNLEEAMATFYTIVGLAFVTVLLTANILAIIFFISYIFLCYTCRPFRVLVARLEAKRYIGWQLQWTSASSVTYDIDGIAEYVIQHGILMPWTNTETWKHPETAKTK